jgi:hypothetical protein
MGLFGGDKKKSSRGDSNRRSTDSGQRKSRRIVVPGGANEDANKGAKRPGRQRPSATPRTTAPAPEAAEEPIEQIPAADPAPMSSPAPVDPTMESEDSFDLLEPLESPEVVPAASASPSSSKVCRSGDQPLLDMLIKTESITAEQAEAAKTAAAADGKPIDVVLAEQGVVDEEKLVSVLTTECWLPHLRVEKYNIKPKALEVLTAEQARYHSVLPIDKLGSILNLAMVNVLDEESAREIENATGLDIKKIVSTRSEIEAGIEKYYGEDRPALEDEAPREFAQDYQSARVTKMLAQANAMSEESLPPEEPVEALADDPFSAADFAADSDDDEIGTNEAVAPITLDLDEVEPEAFEPEATEPLPSAEPELAEPEIVAEAPAEVSDDDLFAEPAAATSAEPEPELDFIEPAPQEPVLEEPTIEEPAAAAPEPAIEEPAAAPEPVAAATNEVSELVSVSEEDFQHAIAAGKQRVFAKWLSLQTRNRILNAVPVEDELAALVTPVLVEPETVSLN